MLINKKKKKNCHLVDFDVPAGQGEKNKMKQKDRQYLAREKVVEHESDNDTNCNLGP